MAIGATSTGGLSAFALKKLFWKTERKHQTNKDEGEQNENRDNGTENQERSESFQGSVRS